MNAFTPGPLQAWSTGFDGSTWAIGPNGKCPIGKTLGGNADLNEANARLWASAPDLLRERDELLEALKLCVQYGGAELPDEVEIQARAAIARCEKGGAL